MLGKLRRYRPSHATIVAYLALFVALGGTSYAVATGAIGSREIENNSVRGTDIRNNDVRGKDIRNGTLGTRDFKAGELPAGAQGPQGPPGPPGSKGDAGDDGAPGATNVVVRSVDSPLGATGSNSTRTLTAPCETGERATGGGVASFNSDYVNYKVLESRPHPETGTPTGWKSTIGYANADEDALTRHYVVCASP